MVELSNAFRSLSCSLTHPNFRIFHPKFNLIDIYPATFLQSYYYIVYSGVGIRGPQNKNDECYDKPKEPDEPWRLVHFDKLRNCIGRGVQALQKIGVSEIFVDPFADAEAAAEAAYLAAFCFDELKSPKKRISKPLLSCFTAHLDNDPDSFQTRNKLLTAWNRGKIFAQAQNQARRWMEMPSNLLPPQTFAREIEESLSQVSCGETSLRVVVHDKDWIEKQNMGGVLGVSRASSQDPCFVEINYVGDPSRPNDHIALVGKGVTFDSGGISIKPAGGMEAMRADMGGAAVMASVVLALAQLQSPINIRVYLPLVENMPDGNALRPGDVLRMASGTTVQVDNTDAEGRLILADALHYAQSNPDAPNPPLLIIDAATLTGAISVSLGDHYTGLFCNQAVQRRRVTDVWPKEGDRDPQQHQQHPLPPTIIGSLNYCGRQKCDPFWHMPTLYSKHLQEGCHLADISNITTGSFARLGGSGSASAFLQSFVSHRTPYVHLDIAGVMKSVSEEVSVRRGMTGRPTRPLIYFLDRLARQNSCPEAEDDTTSGDPEGVC
uniref:Cytosol aminopeptidase n=1 Tax=Mesocestoides corti TaxID=53468 RepID=A0A5K3FR29_MESCO